MLKILAGDNMKSSQLIKCTVYDCLHCNCDKDVCLLREVEIINCHGTGDEETTMCHSYDKKKKC